MDTIYAMQQFLFFFYTDSTIISRYLTQTMPYSNKYIPSPQSELPSLQVKTTSKPLCVYTLHITFASVLIMYRYSALSPQTASSHCDAAAVQVNAWTGTLVGHVLVWCLWLPGRGSHDSSIGRHRQRSPFPLRWSQTVGGFFFPPAGMIQQSVVDDASS